jgi:ABC-type transport system involved in multi-copper enzyme maturation permease subunit
MARFTLKEAIRRRLFFAVIIMSTLILVVFAIVLTAAVNMLLPNIRGGSIPPRIVLLGVGIIITILSIWLVYILSSILTIVLSVGMISNEIEAGTFAVIVPKPLRRIEIVLGKWLGYALLLGIYTALLYLAFLAIIYWKTGYWPEQYISALGSLELSVFALLGLATAGSAFFHTIVNGAIALMLFISAPLVSIVQFIIQLTVPTQSTTMQNISTIVNLVIPTDALWHATSYFLLPSSALLTAVDISSQSFNTPFTSAIPASPNFILWVVLYAIILPLAAVWRFQRRDL